MHPKPHLHLVLSLLLSFVSTLAAQVPGLINYQGRVAVGGVNFDGSGQFKFALVNGDGSLTHWSNDGTFGGEPAAAVTIPVVKGLYSVLLGDTSLTNMKSISPFAFQNDDVRLRVWFNDGTHGFQQLTPDQRIAAAGYAMMAANVPDGAINQFKLAPGAVTGSAIQSGSIDSTHLQNGAVQAQHLAPNAVTREAIADGAVSGAKIIDGALQARHFVTGSIGGAGWAATSAPEDGPTFRSAHTTIWTGSEMIIWGGYDGSNFLNTGSRYNPVTDSWTNVSLTGAPSARRDHTSVWTGTEMIIWGGTANGTTGIAGGARYNPVTDTWAPVAAGFAPSARFNHTAVFGNGKMLIWGGFTNGGLVTQGGKYDPATNTWEDITTTDQASPRRFHTAVWTGSNMIVWGGSGPSGPLGDGAKYNEALDVWGPLSQPNQPSPRYFHSAVWTGSEMLVWGGQDQFGNAYADGARYVDASNQWTALSGTGAPEARSMHTAVWANGRMVVWGGISTLADRFHTGGIYDLASDSWTPTPTENVPLGRNQHTAVWTGREMIVWGGSAAPPPGGSGGITNSGGRFRFSVIAANAVGNEQLAPGAVGSANLKPGAVTGAAIAPGAITPSVIGTGNVDTQNIADGAIGATQMQSQAVTSAILAAGAVTADKIFNGQVTEPKLAAEAVTTAKIADGAVTTAKLADGAVIGNKIAIGAVGSNELQNLGVTAEKLAPGAALANLNASGFTGAPTGSLVASTTPANPTLSAEGYVRVGCVTSKSYWWAGSGANAPQSRRDHTAVWTGTEMIVFGGENSSGAALGNARKYNPATDVWTNLSTTNVPSARNGHTAIWSGTEMIVWGGQGATVYQSTGARYNPTTNTWTAMSAPPGGGTAARRGHTAVWTGSEMIIWGGYNDTGVQFGGFGLRYAPGTDTWSTMSLVNAPDGRHLHTAVWTGTRMIAWGGNLTVAVSLSETTSSGASYDPGTNTWTAIENNNTIRRNRHTAVWTGNEMIVFGGFAETASTGGPILARTHGGKAYSPVSDTWTNISSASDLFPNPSDPLEPFDYSTANHTAVWTGTQMIAWGDSPARGATYNLGTDSWTALPDSNSPSSIEGHSAVWTGTEMIIFGGDSAGGVPTQSTTTLSPGQDMFLFRK